MIPIPVPEQRESHHKVQPTHLKRNAYLYVRQSSPKQVEENKESTLRQYALRERAVALGWPLDRVIVIDGDQATSASHPNEREAFQDLVTAVGMGRAGIVLGLEVQRLARNSIDWQRLLEICALTDTLVLDEDGIYDPKQFNDRLLLNLKGTLSEAELHVIRARLQGGVWNAARRGDLQITLPTGFVYDDAKKVVFDPDKQVQAAFHLFFDTFRAVGSVFGTVRAFSDQKLLFPVRLLKGPRKGELVWQPLKVSRAESVLHNPQYAGIFPYGRTRQRRCLEPDRPKKIVEKRPHDEQILIPHHHLGYITVEQFEENECQLAENAASHGLTGGKGPPREGTALLQGLIVCGTCGMRMSTRYRKRSRYTATWYACQNSNTDAGIPVVCQAFRGDALNHAVGELLVDCITPMSLEVALSVQREIETRVSDVDRLRRQQVERARYVAEAARQRFMLVDPNNRLVADSLEAEWNEKLQALKTAQDDYERQRQSDRFAIDEEQRARIGVLVTDFPKLWRDPATLMRDRKRMARLLIEDVTAIRGKELIAHVRFRGGATRTLTLPLPVRACEMHATRPAVVAAVDELLDQHTVAEIVDILNERGLRSGAGREFKPSIVKDIRKSYSLKTRYQRLRDKGLFTVQEMAKALGVTTWTVVAWRQSGLLRGHRYSDKNQFLYEPPGADAPAKWKHKRRRSRRQPQGSLDQRREVQYEA